MSRNAIIATAAAALVLVAAAVYGTFWILKQPVPETVTMTSDPESTADDAARAPNELDELDEVDQSEVAEGFIGVRLWVLGRSGRSLATDDQEIPLESSDQLQAKQVVKLLLRRSAAIPSDVELRELFITAEGVAYVDLSRELVENHPGGSSAEELTVYSLSNTLIANFPAIKSVRILVEGREIQTLRGHLDLTVPYGRAPSYLRPDAERSESQNETS